MVAERDDARKWTGSIDWRRYSASRELPIILMRLWDGNSWLPWLWTGEAVTAGRRYNGLRANCAKAASSPSRKALRVNRRTPNYGAA